MANAVNDVVYWKQEYDKAAQAGKSKDSLNWISKQAQSAYGQLDKNTASQLQGMNTAQAMAYNQSQNKPVSNATSNATSNNGPLRPPTSNGYSNGGGGGSYGGAGGGVAPMPPVEGLTAEQVQAMLGQWGDNFMKQMGEKDNGMTDMMNSYMAQAAESARQQNTQMQSQYNSLLGQYETGQTNDLNALDRSYEEAKGGMEDDSFQQYLKARQSMANRGLAGSGLANDQDTRLLMANSKGLTGLNNSLLNQKAATNQRYGSLMDNVRNQLAALKSSYQ